MASEQDPSPSPLRLFVDKERNRVVVAEASAEFVDTLFSFLTLPLGTIVRLVSNKQTEEAVEIGCINNLYRSVENFDTRVFWHQICKQMLLRPRNPCETLCEKLRFNVDDTESTKYFMCEFCRRGKILWLSAYAGLKCPCGNMLSREMKLQDEDDSKEMDHEDGAFVKGSTTYLILDDLKVLQNSAVNSVHQLVQLGYTNFDKLTQISPVIGLKEILELLKRVLVSKSTLSDIFLGVQDRGESKPMCSFTLNQTKTFWISPNACSFKIIVSKSKNKILYAEAEGDGFDFLSSFLTTPLGYVLKLLDSKISLGSMENLYNSVKNLSSSWFTGSSGTPLLVPQVAPQHGCLRHPLQLPFRVFSVPCEYWCDYKYEVISKKQDMIRNPAVMELFDPRSADGRSENAVGFVRRPSLFIVTDDLQVTPLISTSSISFLQNLNVPLDDLEDHKVRIGYIEALNLLGAALTSKAALTYGLFHLLKKPNEEAAA